MCNNDCNQGRNCTCGIRTYTWRWLIVVLLAFWLTMFCAVKAFAGIEDVATSTDTYAICKTVDVVSTVYLLENHLAVEANPIVAWGGYTPFIALSVGVWFLLDYMKNKPVTAVVNVATCGVAIHNLSLL